MKIIYFLLLAGIFLIACNEDNSSVGVYDVNTQFKLYDSNGVEKTTFKSGDDFEMRFSLVNLSGRDLSYHYTGIPVFFEIHQNDSIIATSVDGLSFAQVVLGGEVKNGAIFRDNWIAPNSLARDPKLILPAGNYKAFVKHYGFFDRVKLKDSKPVEFVITN
ncbi:MAG: hypothetical protein LC124_09175 [Ignavibacteriales bacterium]|nr:hypothetical protein [Ignavibacteriales bacterium]